MRHFFKKVKENSRSIAEIIVLVVAVFIPSKIDATGLIGLCLKIRL